MRQLGGRPRLPAVAATLALTALVACGGGGARSRASGSALWIDHGGAPIEVSTASRLETAGVKDFFVEAGRLTWSAGSPQVEALPLPALPGRSGVTLVLRGEWSGQLADAEASAKALAEKLAPVARTAEAAGMTVAGWHLDLSGEPMASDAALLAALREVLGRGSLLSVTLPRSALAGEVAKEIVDSTDFVVAFLYGTREGTVDDPQAWDFQQVQAGAKLLDELGDPFLIGVVSQGSLTQRRGGEVVGEVTGVSLADLAWNRALELRHGFTLEGVDRQVYGFKALAATRVGQSEVLFGDELRVVGTSTAYLQDLQRQIASWKLKHHLGELFYRQPRPGDSFSISAESLEQLAGGDPPVPTPQLTVETISKQPTRLVVRVILDNPSAEPSDFGQVESNFVELEAQGGIFVKTDPGSFYRMDIYTRGAGGKLERSPRPTLVRLFAPLLAAGAHLESGPIELVTATGGVRELLVRATFLAPYGASADVPPTSWTQLAPRPTPTPGPSPEPTPTGAREIRRR